MNKIDQKLKEIQEKKKIGLMTHVVVGYPSLQVTVELIQLMENCGVDMVEIQIPFSDPLADGPTIMKACEQSLQKGTKVKDAFEVAKKLQEYVKIPLLFMCYYNTVFRYPSVSLKTSGVESFCRDAANVGISGLIVPDMPLDEEKEERFYFFANQYGLYTIQVVSPVSTEERLRKISKIANGFVYCTARQGITGARKELNTHLKRYLKIVKKYVKVPLAVGFGISQKEHVEALIGKADIAVIGSRLLDIIAKSGDHKREVEHFLNQANMVKYR